MDQQHNQGRYKSAGKKKKCFKSIDNGEITEKRWGWLIEKKPNFPSLNT